MTDRDTPVRGLAPCCLATVAAHGKNNTMMTCLTCEKIIKYFTDATAFDNYHKFCRSRRRAFTVEQRDNCHFIAFNRPV